MAKARLVSARADLSRADYLSDLRERLQAALALRRSVVPDAFAAGTGTNACRLFFVEADANTSHVVTYSDGTYDPAKGVYTRAHSIAGELDPGPGGTIVWTVPRADVGNPPDKATLINTFADTHGSFTVAGKRQRPSSIA